MMEVTGTEPVSVDPGKQVRSKGYKEYIEVLTNKAIDTPLINLL